MKQINTHTLLSPEEEFSLTTKYYNTHCQESAHRLITSNLRFVVKIAMEYKNYGFDIMDLIQEGTIGLMMALKKFNPYQGVKLISFAVWSIKSQIQEFIAKNKRITSSNTKIMRNKLFGNSEKTIESECNIDLVQDFIAEDKSEIFINHHTHKLLSGLNEKEKYIIERRILTDESATYQEIGKGLNISKQRVQQIEKEALTKLKEKII